MFYMGYKRAEWHSGLTYRQTCHSCNATIVYTDDVLDFRPWFADGFVYCTQCKTPLRHNENYAIYNPNEPASAFAVEPAWPIIEPVSAPAGPSKFCTACGHPFADDDRFCSQCGKKR